MKRLYQWCITEIQKIKQFSPRERIWYIWEYYKLWIIGIVSIACLLTWGINHYITTSSDNWFFACFANTNASLEDGSKFWKNYAAYAGYDLGEKNLTFNARCYFDPAGSTYNNTYYQTLITYMDGGSLDVLVMEEDRIQAMGASGRLMDLRDERLESVFGRYEDRLVFCEPSDDYGEGLVPVGISLSGSILTEEYHAYEENPVLAVNALAPHPDQVDVFLKYLFMDTANEMGG